LECRRWAKISVISGGYLGELPPQSKLLKAPTPARNLNDFSSAPRTKPRREQDALAFAHTPATPPVRWIYLRRDAHVDSGVRPSLHGIVAHHVPALPGAPPNCGGGRSAAVAAPPVTAQHPKPAAGRHLRRFLLRSSRPDAGCPGSARERTPQSSAIARVSHFLKPHVVTGTRRGHISTRRTRRCTPGQPARYFRWLKSVAKSLGISRILSLSYQPAESPV